MIAILLGSGMSNLKDYIDIVNTISYQSFCGFYIAPLDGHDRNIYEAKINGNSIIILSGKLHMYEGYNLSQSILPLQYVNNQYNIDQWILTSASGALTQAITVGEWYEVTNFISLEKFSGLNTPKWKSTSQLTKNVTYAYQRGPGLGTVAEYKMLSKFGADLVGMSMTPEMMYLNSINANTLSYSIPVCSYYPISYSIQEPSHDQVIEIVKESISKLVTILESLTTIS